MAIAASTVTFSVVDTVALRRLPFESDGDLIAISRVTSRSPRPDVVAPQDYFLWQEQQTSCEDLAATGPWTLRVQTDTGTETLVALRASANLLSVLRVTPLYGQFFGPQHQQTGQDLVAVISHGLWVRRFGADPGIVGRPVTFGKETRTVLGVLPAGFEYPVGLERPTEVLIPWVPRAAERDLAFGGRGYYLRVIGRLKPGVTLAQAHAEIDRIAKGVTVEAQRNFWRDARTHVTTLHDLVVGSVGDWMRLLLGAVGLVLLVACANVANLLLARGSVRARELAVRTALGASRVRLARAVALESILLATASAGAGILIAMWGVDVVKAALPTGISRASSIALDLRVLAVTVVAALSTGVIFGAVPAWQASRSDVVTILKAGTPGAGQSKARWRSAFLVIEVALVVALLAGTGLFVMSFIRVLTTDLGFDRHNLVRFEVSRSFQEPDDAARSAQQTAFATAAIDRVRQVPGVVRAGIVSGGTPLSGQSTRYSVVVPGVGEFDGEDMVELRGVTSEYFQTTGVRLRQGRLFDERDQAGAPRVAVINDLAARRFFGDRNPIGQTVVIHGSNTVVGVIQSLHLDGPERDLRPELYLPFWQHADSNWSLVVRSSGPPAPVIPAVQAGIPGLGPIAWPAARAFDDQFRILTAERRFNAVVLGILGGIALLIGAAGVYGVIAFIVTQQTREIGVRVALGASPGRIRRGVMSDATQHLVAGAAIGLAAAWAGSRIFESVLFGVTPTDPLVYASVVFVLLATGLAAAWLPARRASRVDPLIALRAE
jgi:predicted permease